MAFPVTIVDILIGLVLILSIPPLTVTYLKGPGISQSFLTKVCVLGVLWVIFGLISEELLETVSSFQRADSYGHEKVAERLLLGKAPHFFDEFPIGNKAYQTFVYGLFLIGAYIPSARAINAFSGLCGGLIIASYLKNAVVWEKHREWMLLAAIFFPSTVFWTSSNMKEGLTYLGICLMYSAVLSTGRQRAAVTPGLIAGSLLCGLMRPHMAFAWLIAIGAVTMLTRGRRVYALLVLAALPLLFWKMQGLAQHDMSSLDSTLDALEVHSAGLRRMGGSVQTGPQIPVISGLLAIFFRPFFWEARSFFMAVSALEIWTLTFIMLRAWLVSNSSERRFLLRVPAVRVAILAVLIISVLFSYLPNDGLLARQRVQVVPALLVLTILPLGVRSFLQNVRRTANVRRPAGHYPPPPPHPRLPGAQIPFPPQPYYRNDRNRGAPD